MSRKANPAAIGGFVLGALALVVLAILMLSSDSLFRAKEQVVSYFPGTVKGLAVGSRVEFQGVQVGQVTSIRLDYVPSEDRFLIPVYYDIWPDTVTVAGGLGNISGRRPLQYFVEERGLRARLDSVSLVTGQYSIALSMQPEEPSNAVGKHKTRIEIPTVVATRDRVANMLQDLDLKGLVGKATAAFEAMRDRLEDPALQTLLADTSETLREFKALAAGVDAGIGPLLERANTAVGDYSALAQTAGRRLNTLADSIEQTSAEIRTLSRSIDKQVAPIGNSAVGAFKAVEGLVGEGSPTRYDLDLLLKEGAGAARSLRLLADYLEQNPDAFIRGKFGGR